MLRHISWLMLLWPALLVADLASVRAEPNLEKRSELAMANALDAVNRARTAWKSANDRVFRDTLAEVKESTELSYSSLQETGKAARRHPKYFKRAEKNLRAVMKKLDGLGQEVSLEERGAVEEVRKRVSDVHDQVLNDIMTRKK